jgi:hypothetical protein
MSPIAIDEYKKAMREEICGVCISFTPGKEEPTRCLHECSGECSLFAHLPEIVDSVSRVDGRSMEPYVAALRKDVCAHCQHQDDKGVCDLRDSHSPAPTWCVLDAYFNLITGVIEDVRKSHV